MAMAGRNGGGGEPGLYGFLFLSLLAHLLVLSLLVFSPALLPRPKLTFGPVYDVQLVSMPESSKEKSVGAAAARNILEGLPSRQPILNKTSMDNLPAVPIHPLQTRKTVDSRMVDVLEALKKNPPPTAPKPLVSSSALPEAARLKAEQTPSPAAPSGDAEFNARQRSYYALIWTRIKGLWTIPQGLVSQKHIEAVVNVRIMRDGTIAGVDLEKSSGNRYYDDSVLRAVRKANPLPPPPGDSLEVGINFRP